MKKEKKKVFVRGPGRVVVDPHLSADPEGWLCDAAPTTKGSRRCQTRRRAGVRDRDPVHLVHLITISRSCS